MKNLKFHLITATAALTTLLVSAVAPSITAHATTASGSAGTGTATITLAPGTINFVQVPDFDFGSHTITASMLGLTSPTTPITQDLIVDDYRGKQATDADAGYHVTAAIDKGAAGFVGTKGNTLTTTNVKVALGNSATGNLEGNAVADITAADTIATGKPGLALGREQTNGGTASIDITNGSLIADTYTATVDYTLVDGV